ncbi:MAG: transglycosylase domain-containing protein [Deltaproteobacteria bacterium]
MTRRKVRIKSTKLKRAALILGGAVGFYVLFILLTLPDVDRGLESGLTPFRTSQIVARDNSVVRAYGRFHYKPVSLSDISPDLIDAFIATEDRRFYSHSGVDAQSILRAVFENVRSTRIKQGASTITQQLARNVFLSHKRSMSRKIQEALIALKLEGRLSKDEILETYLNNIYFGEAAYGIGAAAEIYFGKSPKRLDKAEVALLVGLPQAPSRYNPFENPELALSRRSAVIDNLVEAGKIGEKEAETLKKRRLNLAPRRRETQIASDRARFFSQYVVKQALAKLDMDEQEFWQEGLKVYTTIDPKAQSIAEAQVKKLNEQYGRTGKDNQAALLSMEVGGAVIAYVGGQDFKVSQFDRVSQAKRLAGSLFKVFVYTAAMEKGISPLMVYEDAPIQYGDWKPENYDQRHHGRMTLAHALVKSNNIVAVKLLEDISPRAAIKTAQKMGISSPMDANLALALGAVDVSLDEMTAAVNVLNNSGVYVKPYAIEKIIGRDGGVLYEHKPESREVLSRSVRDTMVELMEGVIRYGTGRYASINRPAAGKTGTSDDYRDAWFIGFTPEITTGVWVGNDTNSKMWSITGGSLPAGIWRTYMSQVLAGRDKREFNLEEAFAVEGKDFLPINSINLIASQIAETLNQGEFKLGQSPSPNPDDAFIDPDLESAISAPPDDDKRKSPQEAQNDSSAADGSNLDWESLRREGQSADVDDDQDDDPLEP